jgi:hypothetical protein
VFGAITFSVGGAVLLALGLRLNRVRTVAEA